MSANEKQVAGAHYATGGVQHWDFVVRVLNGRYLEGNITKYVARCYKKNGIVDVNKALHYCDKLAELYQAGIAHPSKPLEKCRIVVMNAFMEDADLDYWQRRVMGLAATWRVAQDLRILRACIGRVMETAQAAEPDRAYVDPDS